MLSPAPSPFGREQGAWLPHYPLGDPHRMMIGQNRHAKANSDTLGNLTQGAKHDFWTWRTGEPGQKVVLHKPEIIKTHLIGQGTLLERLLV